MSEGFLAEIRHVGFNFPPRNWAQCDGQLLPINQNQALFSLLGTIYGGDGRTTFGLPELRGRAAMHVGNAGTPGSAPRTLGQKFGAEDVVLNQNQIPPHTHTLLGTEALGTSNLPAGNLLAAPFRGDGYIAEIADKPMNAQSIGNGGGNLGHNNMQPFQVLNFIICVQGVFPSRN